VLGYGWAYDGTAMYLKTGGTTAARGTALTPVTLAAFLPNQTTLYVPELLVTSATQLETTVGVSAGTLWPGVEMGAFSVDESYIGFGVAARNGGFVTTDSTAMGFVWHRSGADMQLLSTSSGGGVPNMTATTLPVLLAYGATTQLWEYYDQFQANTRGYIAGVPNAGVTPMWELLSLGAGNSWLGFNMHTVGTTPQSSSAVYDSYRVFDFGSSLYVQRNPAAPVNTPIGSSYQNMVEVNAGGLWMCAVFKRRFFSSPLGATMY
jgi:hypothetical protein